MTRPRPAAIAATSALLLLGVAAGADGAEPIGLLLAQTASVPRGPGFYLNIFKFIPVVLIYLLWARTTTWIEVDSYEPTNLQQDYTRWPIIAFLAGVAGLLMIWLIPFFAVGFVFLLLAWLVPLFLYIHERNPYYAVDEQVMTSYHMGDVANGLMRKLGMKGSFNRNVTLTDVGPPVSLFPKVSADKIDPEVLQEAADSEALISAREVLYDAITRRASEIQMEPGPEQTAVRYRIDGVAHAAEPFDRETGDQIVNILKIYAGLDVNERRKPQDGILGAKLEKRDIELRLETSGTKLGEKASLRILDHSGTVTKLDELGLRPKVVAEVKDLVNLERGMILCCGPVSSGKSTTLYALMREIDRFQKNIVSIEDPIEVKIENVSQNEVNTKAGETFATTLRSLIRTEPDILGIGELRDQETAEIACQVATSKLMVFSTVQAPDTITALFRLLDLGVEPAAVASALTAILGQRLVRVLCETCKEPYKPKPEFLKKANLPADKVDVFYRPPTPNPEEPREPCPDCGDTAYVGRTGIFELLVITDALRELIRENPTANVIKAEARKNGMIYLHEDGLRQVFQGKTSIDELRRVVNP